MQIEVNGTVENYEILRMIEFSVERKSMSIVVRDEDTNKVYLFMKGADVSVVNTLKEIGDRERTIIDNLDLFSGRDGLRTLMFTKRELSEDEVKNIMNLTPDELEKDMYLLGGTGIEDRL